MPQSTLSATTVPGAGSAAVRRRLSETSGTGTVIHAGAHAVYARFGDRVLGIAARGAVQVPAAIATALPTLPDIAVGTPAEVRDGVLHVGGLAVTVDRLLPTGVPRISGASATLLRAALPDLIAVRRQLPGDALEALRDGNPVAVRALLGRGDGLTPVGDDVVAGWLVTTRALGRATEAVADAVRAHAQRTTTLSATLLADAADGESIPEFRTLLLALASGRGVDAAVARLVSVGHTSGAGMLLGAHLATSAHAPEGSPR